LCDRYSPVTTLTRECHELRTLCRNQVAVLLKSPRALIAARCNVLA
jgi:hypothetical protein